MENRIKKLEEEVKKISSFISRFKSWNYIQQADQLSPEEAHALFDKYIGSYETELKILKDKVHDIDNVLDDLVPEVEENLGIMVTDKRGDTE